MIEDPLTGLALIAVLAVVAQWLGARLNIPSVLFLLLAGLAAGPVIDPDELYGDLLFPGIGLGVAVLLFEGGTSLRWRNLTLGRASVIRLVTIGAAIAWIVGATAAAALLDVDRNVAVLIGAVLVVSGPTVVMPLLRVVRAREPVDSILRWEGIVIDPIGAGLAIVVLDAIVEDRSLPQVILRIVTTFGAGLAVGAVAAFILITSLRRGFIADHLHIPATLAALIAAYAVSNELRPEAGLVAVTLLGMAFANQRGAPAGHIAEFNEHLGTAVLGILFVMLGARVEIDEIVDNLAASAGIAAALILIARPASVLAATVGTDTTWRSRAFLMTLAPRGVVAAAVASLFALELEHNEVDPGPMVPVVFSVVVITVTIASTLAMFGAKRLRIAQPKPTGVALIGGGSFAIAFAEALNRLHVPTIHIGLDEENQPAAFERGQLVYRGRLDSDEFHETVKQVGVSTAVALSGVDYLDSYATERLTAELDSTNLYRLGFEEEPDEAGTSHTVKPSLLMPASMTAQRVAQHMNNGGRVRTVAGPHHPRSGWLTLCRVGQAGNVVFDADPTAAGRDDWLIQLGPGINPDA